MENRKVFPNSSDKLKNNPKNASLHLQSVCKKFRRIQIRSVFLRTACLWLFFLFFSFLMWYKSCSITVWVTKRKRKERKKGKKAWVCVIYLWHLKHPVLEIEGLACILCSTFLLILVWRRNHISIKSVLVYVAYMTDYVVSVLSKHCKNSSLNVEGTQYWFPSCFF